MATIRALVQVISSDGWDEKAAECACQRDYAGAQEPDAIASRGGRAGGRGKWYQEGDAHSRADLGGGVEYPRRHSAVRGVCGIGAGLCRGDRCSTNARADEGEGGQQLKHGPAVGRQAHEQRNSSSDGGETSEQCEPSAETPANYSIGCS